MTRSTASPPSAAPRPWKRWLAWLLFLVLVIPLVSLVAQAVRYSMQKHLTAFAWEDLHLVPPPPPLAPDILAEVKRRGQFPARIRLQDAEMTTRLLEELKQHPWVQQVYGLGNSVRGRPGLLVSYRRPVALVEVEASDGLWAVDAAGVVLPVANRVEEVVQDMPRIHSPFSPRGAPGQAWGVAEVEAAAAAVALLYQDWKALRLRELRIDNRGLVSQLRLVTQGGSEILWSEFPAYRDEVSTEEKHRRLLHYVTEFSSLDAPEGPYLFDPRPPSGLLRTRLKK